MAALVASHDAVAEFRAHAVLRLEDGVLQGGDRPS